MHALLLLVLGALAPVETPKDEEIKKELAKLQGVWRITAVEMKGRQMPAENLPRDRFTLVVVGNDYVFSTHAGALKIDPSKRPKVIDCTITGGRYKGKTSLGVYELEGGALKLSLASPLQGGPRPAVLKSEQGAPVYSFEREAGVTKEVAAAQLKQLKAALPPAQPAAAAPRPQAANLEQTLDKILDRLDRIDKRLESLERKMTR